MGRAEIQRRFKERRKELGICRRCAKPLDRDGVFCVECREFINKENREMRHWYQEHGICPRCFKNDILGDEKTCPECKARDTITRMKRAETVDRKQRNESHNEWARNKYAERVEQGICTRCGKRKADYGFKTCGICRAKDTETRRVRNGVKEKDWREQQGVCHFCDRPVKPGYKVCEEHYHKNIEKLKNEKCMEVRKRLGKDNEKFFLK